LVKASNPLCLGDENGKIELLAKGGNSDYTYILDNVKKNSVGVFTDLTDNEYALQVIDKKGCKQSITPVKLTWPTALSAKATPEDPKCVGENNGKITLNLSGGIFPYIVKSDGKAYDFTDNYTFDKLPAGQFKYQLNDKNGCQLSLAVKLAEPQLLNPIVFDAPKEVCKGQVVTLDAKNPNRIIQWYRNAKELSKDQKIDISEPDDYSVSVKNTSGCEITGKYTLVNNKNALKSDFLMAVQAFVGDTVVALDITSPKPDEIQWKLPGEAYMVKNNINKIFFQIVTEGKYEVKMYAKSGECSNIITRSLEIFKRDDVDKTDPTLGYKDFNIIQKLDVSPNPNYGHFTVNIELTKVNDAEVLVTRSATGALFHQEKLTGKSSYSFDVQLKNFQQDIYIVTLRTGNSSLVKKILVIN
jgi:hypothetical protein